MDTEVKIQLHFNINIIFKILSNGNKWLIVVQPQELATIIKHYSTNRRKCFMNIELLFYVLALLTTGNLGIQYTDRR